MKYQILPRNTFVVEGITDLSSTLLFYSAGPLFCSFFFSYSSISLSLVNVINIILFPLDLIYKSLRQRTNRVYNVSNQYWLERSSRLYLFDGKSHRWKLFSEFFGSQPLQTCYFMNSILYGVYCRNPYRLPIQVYKTSFVDAKRSIMVNLPLGRHIHSIFFDQYDRCFY